MNLVTLRPFLAMIPRLSEFKSASLVPLSRMKFAKLADGHMTDALQRPMASCDSRMSRETSSVSAGSDGDSAGSASGRSARALFAATRSRSEPRSDSRQLVAGFFFVGLRKQLTKLGKVKAFRHRSSRRYCWAALGKSRFTSPAILPERLPAQRPKRITVFLRYTFASPRATVERPFPFGCGVITMGIWILVAVFLAVLLGLVIWMLLQNTQGQKKNDVLEAQMNELRRDLLGLSSAQAQSSTKMETIANTVAARLEAVTGALQQGATAAATITSQSQAAMSTELKNTREQITQIQQQLGQVQESGHLMHEAASRLEGILGGTKSRGSFGETTLERLLEDCLPRTQYTQQYRFRSGEAADAVIHLRDRKLMVIDSKFPLESFQRMETDGEAARKDFMAAVKTHADSIAKKYIVPDEDTLDLALMFVPSEAVYYELLRCVDPRGIGLDAYCRNRRSFRFRPIPCMRIYGDRHGFARHAN